MGRFARELYFSNDVCFQIKEIFHEEENNEKIGFETGIVNSDDT